MTRIIFFLLVVITFIACNETNKTSAQETAVAISDTVPSNLSGNLTGCYMMTIGQDTALMNIEAAGDAVSGTLQYNRFEKDSNKGTFTGNIVPGSKIVVWYQFQSEGKISVRQSIFKIMDKGLAEGYGDIAMQNDTVVFKFPQALSYEENHPFIKTPCTP